MGADSIEFNPTDQGEIAKAAAVLFSEIKNSLPRVPWFSHRGQQKAFSDIAKLIVEKTTLLNADMRSKKAIVFWTLAITYANKKSFQLATASVKNPGFSPVFLSKIEQTFVNWIGQEIHPGIVVAAAIEEW